jgi:hypothetical protein
MKRFGLAILLVLLTLPFLLGQAKSTPDSGGWLKVDEPAISAVQSGNTLMVTLPVSNPSSGTLSASGKVQVMDLTGKSFGLRDRIFAVRAGSTSQVRIGIPLHETLSGNMGLYNIQYRILSQGKTVEGTRSLLPMMYPYSIRVLGGDAFAPGQTAAVRIIAFRTGSDQPVENVAVHASLRGGDRNYDLFQGVTQQNGTLPVQFTVPQAAPGSYKLVVDADHSGIRQEVSAGVRLEPMFKIYITTDKPIYQPSQTIHFRCLSLSAIQGAPASAADFVWEVRDPKGNRLFKKETKTDRFGIAAADFELADEVNLGTYKIRGTVRIGGFEQFSERDVIVSRYVLPKFKLEVTTDRNYYQPAEQVSGHITANYFFGKPVEGKVELTASKFDIGFTDFYTDALVLKDGKADFSFRLPDRFAGTPLEQGNAFVELKAVVTDSAGQEQEAGRKMTVTQDPIVVAALPASLRQIAGVENRLLVVTQYPDGTPAKTEVTFANRTVRTSDSGVAVVKFVPAAGREYVVDVRDATGKTASRHVALETTGRGLILTPSRGIYRVGERLDLQIFSNVSKTVYIDLIKNNQTLKTEAVDTEDNRASSSTDLSADFVGSVMIHVYGISREGEIYRDSRWIVVEPANTLEIRMKPDKDSYRPGDEGKVRFTVTDQNGKGVASALGIAVVDEAVFSVSELRPGLEKVYFLLEQELQKPRYEIHTLSFGPILERPLRDVDQTQAEAALANTSRDFSYKLKLDSYDDTARQFVSQCQDLISDRYLPLINTISEAINSYYQRYQTYPPARKAMSELIGKRFLRASAVTDPWGQPMEIRSNQKEVMPWDFTLFSRGPDEVAGTADDVQIQRPMPMLAMQEADGVRGGIMRREAAMAAPPMMKAKGAPEPAGAGAEEPRVREYFPETLLFEPALITDGNGQGTLDVQLADSITDWRVTVTASSARGELGSTTGALRVFQDFFVDPDLPVALTKGDEVTIPVAVYNYLKERQTVKLDLQASDWFSSLDASSVNLALEPGQVTSTSFRIRADRLGKQKLTVKAYGNKLSDAVQREILIEPNGRKIEETVNGRVGADASASIDIPADAIEGSRQLLLKIYPGMFNQLLEGLDSILQMPYGCFEQTSSATYPNVLALEYMKKTQKATPEVQMKAEGYINLGYQRLVTFEVPGGGFSWFGSPPANKILTSYGLMEFKDMSSVYDIDPDLISRTAAWLAAQQQPDGSWKPDEGGIAEGAINRYQTDLVRIASYIGWALVRAGGQEPAADRAADYVAKNFQKTEDPYGLAVAANFLLERNPKNPAGRQILAKLFTLKVEDSQTIYWKQDDATSYSSGPSAYVETTALAALAFMKDPEYSAAVGKMLTYLIQQKDPRGTWYSTQATIWALRAFVEALGGRREAADAVVDVLVNGKAQKQVKINESNSDVVQLINVSDASISGKNTLQLKMHGKAAALFALVTRYAVPWKELPGKQALDIRVSYDKTNLEVDDTAVARVSIRNNLNRDAGMVIVDLGIPPGFRISTDDLDRMVDQKTIQKYSLTGRQAILYFESLKAGRTVEFSYHVTARFPIKASSTPTRVYEYYDPQREDVAVPVQVEVAAKM